MATPQPAAAASIARPSVRGASPMASAARALALLSVGPSQQAAASPQPGVYMPASSLAPSASAAAAPTAGASEEKKHLLGKGHEDHFHHHFVKEFGGHMYGDPGHHERHSYIHERRTGYGHSRRRHRDRDYMAVIPPASEAPSPRVQWGPAVRMHNNAYCRVTRSYESSPMSGQTNKIGPSVPDDGNWIRLWMGGFNTPYSAATGFFPTSTTIGRSDGVAISFHFDESIVTGVTDSVGPRIVRGGPTNTSYLTSAMTQDYGWVQWNNDFYMFSNIFRYSRLEKLELIVRRPPHNVDGYTGVDSSPYTNNSVIYQDRGMLYVMPWAGQTGIVADYTTGEGQLNSSQANGINNAMYFEQQPGVAKFPMSRPKSGYDQFEIRSFPIKPIQPTFVDQQSNTGPDSQITFGRAPVVDGYHFTAGTQNHNCFGWVLHWDHPDFNGIATTTGANNTVIPPWIDIKFRATMSYWGLLGPDLTPGTAPLLSRLMLLPGFDEARNKAIASDLLDQETKEADLAASLADLQNAMRPAAAAAAASTPEDQEYEMTDLPPPSPLKRLKRYNAVAK